MGNATNLFLVLITFVFCHGCFNNSDPSPLVKVKSSNKDNLNDFHLLRFDKPPGHVDLRTFISVKVQGVNKSNYHNSIQVIRGDNNKRCYPQMQITFYQIKP